MNEGSLEMQKKKAIPEFRNEDEGLFFWSDSDSVDYVDWTKASATPAQTETLHPIDLHPPT